MATTTKAVRNVTVEAVTNKSKYPKFNAGALLIEGKWTNVAKKVDIEQFRKNEAYALEIETNEKGYDSVVGVVDAEARHTVSTKERIQVAINEARNAPDLKAATKTSAATYNETKDKRILVQGLVQAVVQSPALAGLPFTTVKDISKNVKELSLDLIQFVLEQSK